MRVLFRKILISTALAGQLTFNSNSINFKNVLADNNTTGDNMGDHELKRRKPALRKDEIDKAFPEKSVFFDISGRFSIKEEYPTNVLGLSDASVLSSSALYEFIGNELARKLGSKLTETIKDRDGSTVKTPLAQQLELLIGSVFANEQTYREFLQAPDQQAYLINTYLVGTYGGTAGTSSQEQTLPSNTVLIGPTPKPGTIPQPTTNITANPTTNISTVILERESKRAASTFLNAFRSIRIPLDEFYKKIIKSEDLTKVEKQEFNQMFITLRSSSKPLSNTFLITVWASLNSPTNNLKDNYPVLMEYQLDTLERLWGRTVANPFRSLTSGSALSLSSFERYLDVVYANLSLGSMLIGNFDKPLQATFSSLFTSAFLGGLSSLYDTVAGATVRFVSDTITTLIGNAIGPTGTPPTGQQALPDAAQAYMGAITSFVSLLVGAPAGAFKSGPVNRFFLMHQALCSNLSTIIGKNFSAAGVQDSPALLLHPMVLTPTLGMVAAFANNPSGIRGLPQITMQYINEFTATPSQTTTLATRDVISRNVIDLFKSMLQHTTREKYQSREHIVGAITAAHLVVYSVERFGNQKDTIVGLGDIGDEVIEILGDMKSVEDIRKFAALTYSINNTGNHPLNEVVDIYKKASRKGKDPEAGFKALEEKLKEFEKTQGAELLRGIPRKTKLA